MSDTLEQMSETENKPTYRVYNTIYGTTPDTINLMLKLLREGWNVQVYKTWTGKGCE